MLAAIPESARLPALVQLGQDSRARLRIYGRDGNLAAILLASFTVVSGLIKPRVRRPRRAKQAREPAKDGGPRLVELPTALGSPGA